MNEILDALADQHAELGALLAGFDDADWQRPSRCEGWTVADVVLHLAQTDEMAIGSATGRFAETVTTLSAGLPPTTDVDGAAAALVAHQRGASSAAVHQRWRTGADALDRVLRVADPHARVTWVAGELSVHTLATTRLTETWIHTGDIAHALGRPQPETDGLRHIARLAWRTLPYAFTRAGRELHGPVSFRLRGPGGDAWDFEPDGVASTTITGEAVELCLLAGQRARPGDTALRGDGPDAGAVLELVRTFA